MDHAQQSKLVVYVIIGVVFLSLFAFRMRRMMQSRPFRLETVWVVPLILIVLTAFVIYRQPPQGREWLWVVGSLVIGGLLGWFRAKTIRLTVNPTTREVMAQGSPLAMVFLLAIFAVRFGLRGVMAAQSSALGIRLAMVDSVFLAMACGLFVARTIEMGIRATRLLAQSPASTPAT